MTITAFSTITLKATPNGVTEAFTDNDSIQANSVRAYNNSTVEAFLSVGSIVNFPVPPNDSVILNKGAGNASLTAMTESGSATIRCTAIQETGSNGDAMGILDAVSVLKDAMGNQAMIDKAAKKISDANKISAANKKEADEALKTIADAKAATTETAAAKADLEAKIASHSFFVTKKSSELDAQQADIDKQRLSLKTLHQEWLDEIAKLQSVAEERHVEADKREAALDEQSKKNVEDASKNSADKAVNDAETKRLQDLNTLITKEKDKLDACKKRIADATKED